MPSTSYDLVVIGAGPGGYVGAIRASQLGMNVACIERDKPGGVCLNIGCIPSKALIHQAELFRAADGLADMGVAVDTRKFSYESVFKKSRQASDTLSKGVAFLLKKNKIKLIKASASVSKPGELKLDNGDTLAAKNILVATGSSPRAIPGFEFDGKQVLSSDHALMLTKLPKSMLILGGGAIGAEFAHIMNAFGVEVHLVEMLDHILPLEDTEIVKVLQRSFSKRGITLYEGTKASSLKKTKAECTVELETKDGNKQSVSAEQVLVVVGRAPNTKDIGLEKIGVEIERGFVKAGDYYQTAANGVFAVGDIVASPMLAHVASKEAEIAVEFMAGHTPAHTRLDPNAVPGAVYCEPQVASFGYSEEKAKEAGITCETATFPYRGAGKSVAVGKSEGMVKIVYDPEVKEILGAHIVGADATELIHEILLAKSAELLPEDIATMVHAHPTMSESIMEAMRAVEGWAIHI
ncbi:MAG: dihydrolipoyl dehydrogenase [Chitinivibrionales bacterium]|nr:dihydrolipoyl dehydrogenase [Chitinivibrionales bacterium]MBD3396448.1 dihydrolipoyl dehydrogenase [Chitinivibrionales bacterium]